jgi:hypothetical protein
VSRLAAYRPILTLTATGLLAACVAQPRLPVPPGPTRSTESRSTPAPVGSNGELGLIDGSAEWRPARIRAPDAARFRVASAESGVVAGDRTVWAIDADGSWIPADEIGPNSRWGLVAWRGGFVDWGQLGATRTSDDGLAWRDARAGPGEANLSMIVPAGDRLLLVGESTKDAVGAWLSVDGSTWEAAPSAPAALWAAVVSPERGMVVAGSGRPEAVISVSVDGVAWRSVAAPAAPDGAAFVTGLAIAPGAVVAIGGVNGRPASWRSTDLSTWTEAATPWGRNAELATVVAIGGTLVIAGARDARPALWLSLDGLRWSAIDLPVEAGIRGEATRVRPIDGAIVAFGYATHDEGNGGSTRVADLVWTLQVAR